MPKVRRRFIVIVGFATIAVLFGGIAKMAAEPLDVLATSARTGPIALKPEPVTVALAPRADAGGSLAALPPGRKLYVMLTGLRTNVQPEVLYQVFLALPPGVAAAPDSIHLVGTINFFNAATGNTDDRTRFFSYDVTDLVRTLQARKLLGDTATVTLAPAGPPNAAARPIVGEIALVRE